MTRGKKTCKILKEIRTQIAEKNDIEYVTSECEFQGECKGTCPKCEAEVRYLENELRKRQQLGKVVTIAGISLGVAGTFAACGNSAPQSDEKNSQIEDTVKVAPHPYMDITLGSPIEEPASPVCVTTTTSCTPTVSKGKIKRVPEVLLGEPSSLYAGGIPPKPPTIEAPILMDDTIAPPEKIERFPDIKAEFPGGAQALMKYFNENRIYPQDAFDEGVSGVVLVEFVVRVDGTISNVTVIKKVHPSLDKEAVRVMKSMPQKWKPGSTNGEAVASYFQLPVQFKKP